MTLNDLALRLREFVSARDWDQFHTPKNLAMALAGEVGELLAELQWLTPEESERVMADPESAARMRSELADVTIYLVRLADLLGVDLVEAARAKLAESDLRYDVENYRGSARNPARPSDRPQITRRTAGWAARPTIPAGISRLPRSLPRTGRRDDAAPPG